MEDKGLRFNQGKTRHDLVPTFAQEQYAKVLTKGAEKYSANNWREGMGWSKVVASLKRHILAFERGEDFDKETGLLHMAHAMCNTAFLLEYYKIYPQGDDRPRTYFNKRIGLDIDGVLADFNVAVREKYGIENRPTAWYYSYKFDSRMWKELSQDKDFWVNIPPYFDGSQLPFEPVCYVTHRNVPKEWCEEWLEKNNFPCVPVHVVGGSKVEIIKSLDLDCFVDDKYQNFVELNNAGILTYLLDRVWNRRYDVGFRRIKSLNELMPNYDGAINGAVDGANKTVDNEPAEFASFP